MFRYKDIDFLSDWPYIHVIEDAPMYHLSSLHTQSSSSTILAHPAKHASIQASEFASSGARENLAVHEPFLSSSSPSSSLMQRPGQKSCLHAWLCLWKRRLGLIKRLLEILTLFQYRHRCRILSCRKDAYRAASCPTYYCRIGSKCSLFFNSLINYFYKTINKNWIKKLA